MDDAARIMVWEEFYSYPLEKDNKKDLFNDIDESLAAFVVL